MTAEIISENKEVEEKKCLIKQIDEAMGIHNVSLYVFLATQDSRNIQNGESLHKNYRDKEGFYINTRQDKIPFPMPLEIPQTLQKEVGPDYRNQMDHFIWIKKKILYNRDAVKF